MSALKRLLAEGKIEESISSWNSPPFTVPKKFNPIIGKMEYCLVNDFRNLNTVTRKQIFPLPLLDDVLYRFRGKSVFSTLDFDSGFHQIRIADESKPKTAFSLRHGHYQWKVLPMGV